MKGVIRDIRRAIGYKSEDFGLEHLDFLNVRFFGSAPYLYTI